MRALIFRTWNSLPFPMGRASGYVLGALSSAVAVGVVGLGLGESFALTRDALLPVVQACVANHELTGAAFPCLEVNLAAGKDRGYVVLRPPIGAPDTILVPTRRSVGIEDPWLQDASAPDFFAAAWRSRSLATGDAPVSDDRVALAINSKFARSQDQFHIHIGCLGQRSRLWMRAEALKATPGAWRQVERRLGGAAVWARAIPSANLEGVNPIRLAAIGIPSEGGRDSLAFVTMALAPAKLLDGSDGFVAFAWRHDPDGPDDQITAEDFLSPKCL